MKIQNYDIVCLPYPTHPSKIEGSYMVSINLDNTVFECLTKVKDPETGLDHIKEFIKNYEFVAAPDLTIKETNHLGKHIFTKHHELHSTN